MYFGLGYPCNINMLKFYSSPCGSILEMHAQKESIKTQMKALQEKKENKTMS